MPGRLTFVSVVFGPELPLQQLQARSFARFMPREMVARILVLDNSAGGVRASRLKDLVGEYGVHADAVRIARPSEVSELPRTTGWRSQQILKLEVARLVDTPVYVALDAKNHLVATPRSDFFESADGRVRMGRRHSYSAHSLRPSLERVLSYLDLDGSLVEDFPTTATPFNFDTALVRQMLADVGAQRSFAKEFLDHDLTEFFLYSAWVRASGRSWDDVFDFGPVECPVLWPSRADAAGVQGVASWVEERGTPFIGVHRKALLGLDLDGREALASYWSRTGLFDSVDDAQVFLADFRRSCARLERRARLHDLPGALRQQLRRARPTALARDAD